jgi:hypothetical protein
LRCIIFIGSTFGLKRVFKKLNISYDLKKVKGVGFVVLVVEVVVVRVAVRIAVLVVVWVVSF